jgi:hypothetical protein
MVFLLQKTQTENSAAFFLPVNIVAENKKPLISQRFLKYPEPESNRHGFPQVFETSASTNSAIRA